MRSLHDDQNRDARGEQVLARRAVLVVLLVPLCGCLALDPRFELTATRGSAGQSISAGGTDEGGTHTEASGGVSTTGGGSSGEPSRTSAADTAGDSSAVESSEATDNSGGLEAAGELTEASDATETRKETESSEGTSTGTEDSTEDSSSGTEESSTSETGAICVRELCGEFNVGQSVDDTLFTKNVLFGLKILIAGAEHSLVGVQLITGEAPGVMQLSVWTDSGGRPGQRMGQYSWSPRAAVSWQGGDFDTPYDLADDEVFWLIWDATEGAQAPISVTGTTQAYYTSENGGVSWISSDVPHPWRVRFYCCDAGD